MAPCQEPVNSWMLDVSQGQSYCESKRISDTMVRVSEKDAKSKLDRRWEEAKWIGQEIDECKTKVKYSYYTILILDTV